MKSIYYKSLLSLFFGIMLISLSKDSFSQATNTESYTSKIIPPSPTAASLAKPAESTVSYYTGTSSTTLPIYTIADHKLSVPISLSFHQGGIRVEEEASYVGLGVSLNAGGVITRTIKAGDDLNENWGYAFNVFPQNFTLGTVDNPDVLAYYQKYLLYQQDLDTEPDLFYYNVGGVSGKFVLQALTNNSFPLKGIPLDKSNVKIICNKISTNNYQWIITLDNGTVYNFSEQEVTANASSGTNSPPQTHESLGTYYGFDYNSGNIKQVSAWFLSSITSVESTSTIQFNYYTDKLYTSTSRILYSESFKSYDNTCNGASYCNANCGAVVGGNSGTRLNSSLTAMQNKYLKSITFQNGKLDFVSEDREDIQRMFPYSASGNTHPFDDIFTQSYGEIITTPITVPTDGKPQRLKEIQLKDNAGALVKKWIFNYGYFNQNLVNMNASTKTEEMTKYNNLRLRLNNVKESDAVGVTLPATTFIYEGDTYNNVGQLVYATLPSKVSVQKDLFGFYNGAGSIALPEGIAPIGQGDLIQGGYYPKLTFNVVDPAIPGFGGFVYVKGIDRKVDDAYKTRGVLKQVIYPTGGSKRFEYESHEALGGIGDVESTNYTQSFLLTDVSNTYFQLLIDATCTGPNSGNNLCGISNDPSTVIASFQYGSNTTNITFGQLSEKNCSIPATGIKQCSYEYRGTLTPASSGNYSFTSFFSNKFSSRVNVLKYHPINDKVVKLGGLRVKKSISSDNLGNNYTTKYDYIQADNITGSGIQLTPLVKYSYGYIEQYILEGTTAPTSCTGGQYGLVLSAKSHTPLGSALGGNHVGYSRVIETQIDGIANNGSTVYEYLNTPLTNVKHYSYYADAPIFPSYGNGMITRQAVYDKDNNLLQETLNTPIMAQSDVTVKGLLINFGYGTLPRKFTVNPFYYDVRSEFWYNQQTIQRQYKGVNYVETVTTTRYDTPNYYHPTSTETQNSKGQLVKTVYKYPYNYTVQPYLTMQTKNILSPVVEETMLVNNVQTSLKATDYATFGTMQLPLRIRTKAANYAEQTQMTFDTYDVAGNLTSYTPINGLKVNLTYFDTIGKINLLKTQTNNLGHTTTYDYLPLIGLSLITDPNGRSSTYTYDSFNRLNNIKDPNGKIVKSYQYNYQNQ